jgi:Domain of unknown function (DUF929)
MASTKQRSGGSNVPPRPSGSSSSTSVPKRPTGKASGATVSKPGRPPQRASARRAAEQRRKRNILTAAGAVGVIVVVIAVVVVLKVTGGSGTPKGSDPGTFALTSSMISQVEDVPVSALVAAAKSAPDSAAPAQKLPAGTELLMKDGKPEILYMGAEYCPFCAAERWSLVMALSKFGTFTGLRGTTSSATDTNPSTPTFSFYGSTYTSKYISFVPVEMETNTEATLQTPTSEQNALLAKWDVAPYTTEDGSIPFVYLGGKYLITGAQYEAPAISGESFQSAVPYMTSGTNATSKGAEAAAAYLVGEILALTHDQPASIASQVPASLKGITTSSASSGNHSVVSTTATTAKKAS